MVSSFVVAFIIRFFSKQSFWKLWLAAFIAVQTTTIGMHVGLGFAEGFSQGVQEEVSK